MRRKHPAGRKRVPSDWPGSIIVGGVRKYLFFRNLDRHQMQFACFMGFIAQYISQASTKITKCLNFKVELVETKPCFSFHHSVHPPLHASCYLLDAIERGWPSKLYYLAIMCQERNVMQTNKKNGKTKVMFKRMIKGTSRASKRQKNPAGIPSQICFLSFSR